MAFLPDSENIMRLFLIGGLDPITYSHVLSVEVYDEAAGAWNFYRDLPYLENIFFPASPDTGCMGVLDGKVFTVGAEVVSLDWSTWEVETHGGLEESALNQLCIVFKADNEDNGLFFLSGDWFSLTSGSWRSFPVPFSSFNLANFDNKPTILGLAHRNGTCSEGGCNGNTLYGDSSVLQHDLESNTWTEVGRMVQDRLAFTRALQVPGAVCTKILLNPDFSLKSEGEPVGGVKDEAVAERGVENESKLVVDPEPELEKAAEADHEQSSGAKTDTEKGVELDQKAESESITIKIKETTKRTTRVSTTTRRTTTPPPTTTAPPPITTTKTTATNETKTRTLEISPQLQPKSSAPNLSPEFMEANLFLTVVIIKKYIS